MEPLSDRSPKRWDRQNARIYLGRRFPFDRGEQAGVRALRPFVGCFILIFLLLNAWGMPSVDSHVRTVRVKIAYDERVVLSGVRREEIKPLLLSASHVFKKEFSLRFLVKTHESWRPEKSTGSPSSLLSDLRKKVPRGDEELVIGIISPDRLSGNRCGFTSCAYGYILIESLEPRSLMMGILLHELCHVFGAVDLEEPGSIMSTRRADDKFDEFTRQVVLLNRGRTFLEEPYVPDNAELDELIDLHEQRDRTNGQDPGVKFALAGLYLMKNQLEAAAGKCIELLEANPDSLETINLLGSIYNRQGRIDQAISSFRRASELNPALPELHFNLGLAYSKKGDAESAVIEYQRAVQLNSGLAIAQANLGCQYLILGQSDHAIAACRAALRACPDLAEALCTLGAALITKGTSEVSMERPFSFAAAGKIAGSLDEAGGDMVEEAIACCLKALRLKPTLPEPHNVLGLAYEYLGRTEEAEAEYLEALKIRTDFIEARFNLGALYFRNRNLDKAALQLAKIMEANPSSGLGYKILSTVFQQRLKHAGFPASHRSRDY
ncbi:MAG: tetratricopeptide repeat protein [Candidatus Aminicenantales bacterium]